MDWQLAITRNREALLAVVSALMGSVGLVAGGTLTTLPHFLYRKALLILHQAESALRRLIVIAARAIICAEHKPRAPRKTPTDFALLPKAAQTRVTRFNLIDPLKIFGQEAPVFPELHQANKDDFVSAMPVSAAALGARLLALQHALKCIPHHAKRLARWYKARDFALRQNVAHRFSPLRPGPPPGARQRKRSEMDKVLAECHSLAIYARDRRDSS